MKEWDISTEILYNKKVAISRNGDESTMIWIENNTLFVDGPATCEIPLEVIKKLLDEK